MNNITVPIAIQHDEQKRLTALARYKIFNTPKEPSFDELAQLACLTFSAPMCLISFVGEEEIFFKANIGFGDESSEKREGSICTQTICYEEVTVVEDIYNIPHLANNVHGVRFYAGAPLVSPDGYRIGTICIMYHQPMEFDQRKRDMLSGLSKVVMDRVELRLINQQVLADNSNLIAFQEKVTQANSALENAQDDFYTLFQHAPIAIGICSSPGKIVRQANSSLLNILGKDSTLIGKSIEVAIPDVEGQSFYQILDQVHSSGESYQATELKVRIARENGYNNLYANCSFQLVGNLGDDGQHMIFILSDVTEQVIARQLNEEANIVLTSAIEAGGMGYTVVDLATWKMTSNDQFKNNYGYTADDDFSYSDLFDAMLPKYRQIIKKAVQDAIETNGVYRAEYEVRWGDGSIHWIRAFGKPRYDGYGRASHIIGLNKIIIK